MRSSEEAPLLLDQQDGTVLGFILTHELFYLFLWTFNCLPVYHHQAIRPAPPPPRVGDASVLQACYMRAKRFEGSVHISALF